MPDRDFWGTAAPAALIVAAAFAVAYLFVKPAPPRRLTIAVAADEGGAAWYAKRYQKILARDGITLEIRQSSGSLASVRLLADPASGVDAAFVQSGTDAKGSEGRVVSLGALSYVPLWVFYRGPQLDELPALAGRRIAVGAPESGTRSLATTLLSASGADKPPTQILELDREASIAKLERGEIDAAFVVSPAEAPLVKRVAAEPGIRLLDFSRGDAYARRFPYLRKLTLPRGVFDLASDVPDHDVTLVSATENLLASTSLHPALAYLLLRAATEVHESAGILDDAGEFPAPREAGFPISAEAQRYYKAGVPFLQRYLPFWAANLVDRLWVMLLPIIAVMVPLGRIVPAVYQWRVRSRVFRWYGRLKQIELECEGEPGPSPEKLREMLARLDETERAVNRIPTPLAYAENLYFFREHVEVVRRRIRRRMPS